MMATMKRLLYVMILALLPCVGTRAQAQKGELLNPKTLWIDHGDRKIFGVLNRPLHVDGKMPIAIVSHGFNGTHHFAQDYFGPLAEKGYMVYAFDFPCGSVHSQSDSNTMNMSIVDEQGDLCAIVDYFRHQPYVDASHIVLIGESQGGLVSALTAAKMKGKVSQLVLIYPALCIPDNWNKRYPRMEDIPDTTRLWDVPMGRRFFEEVKSIKVFGKIDRYKNPVLIVQGDADAIVSMEDSRRAVEEYKNARLHVIHGAGHGFKPHERKEAIGQILSFLQTAKR